MAVTSSLGVFSDNFLLDFTFRAPDRQTFNPETRLVQVVEQTLKSPEQKAWRTVFRTVPLQSHR